MTNSGNNLKTIEIIRSSKEQIPWNFSSFENVRVQVDNLKAGDYTVVGHDQPGDDNSIIIERKEHCRELCANLGTKWEQFENEAKILSQYKYKQIVVCGPNNFEYLISRDFTKLNLNYIYRQLSYLYVYYGISIVFFPDKEEAQNYVFRLFHRILRKTEDEN